PGTADDYLEGVQAHWLPVAARRGLTLAGAWRTAMRDTEAVLLWCLPTLGDYVRHLSDFATARETREWTAKARLWRTDYRETLLRSEEHTSELQSRFDLVCRLLLEKKKT